MIALHNIRPTLTEDMLANLGRYMEAGYHVRVYQGFLQYRYRSSNPMFGWKPIEARADRYPQHSPRWIRLATARVNEIEVLH